MAHRVTGFSAFAILLLHGCAVFTPSSASAAPSHAHSRRLKVRKEGGHKSLASSKLKLRRAHTAKQPSCSIDLKTEFTGITFDYICDVTDFLLHNDGDGSPNWDVPQPVSGCHQYVAYWNQEHAKPACSVGGACSACSDSLDLAKKTVYIQGGTCEPCGPDASSVTTNVAVPATTVAPVASASAFDLADKNGDGVLSRDEYNDASQGQQDASQGQQDASQGQQAAAGEAIPLGEEFGAKWDTEAANWDEEFGAMSFDDARATAQAAIAEEAEALKSATPEETPAEERAAALLAKAMAAELKASTLGEKNGKA